MMPTRNANEPTPISTLPTSTSRIGTTDSDNRSRAAMAIRMQRAAILDHCGEMTRRLGRPVSLDEAARDWIPIYAELWRSRYERQMAARDQSMCPSQATPGNS